MLEINIADIGKRIRATREEQDVSRKALAEKTGIPYRTMENFELGSQEPSVSRMRVIATTLGVSEGFLIDGLEDPKEPPVESVPVSDEVDFLGVEEADQNDDELDTPTNVETALSLLTELDTLRDDGFATRSDEASHLLDKTAIAMEELSPDDLAELIRARHLMVDVDDWLDDITEHLAEDRNKAIEACEDIAQRLVDTAVFDVDLHDLANDAITSLGETVGLRFGVNLGFVRLGLLSSNRDAAIKALRPALRKKVLSGDGPDAGDGDKYPLIADEDDGYLLF